MNYLDVLLIVPLAWAAWKGFTKGLIIEIASLVGLVLGVYGAVHFSYLVGDWLKDSVEADPQVISIISFTITFLAIVALVYTLAKVLERFVNLIALKLVNKLSGLGFGVLKMAMILSVVLMLINALDNTSGLIPEDLKEESLLYEPVAQIAPLVVPRLKELSAQHLGDSLMPADTVLTPEEGELVPADSLSEN